MAIAMECPAMLKTAADFSISLRVVLRLWPQAMPALRLEIVDGAFRIQTARVFRH